MTAVCAVNRKRAGAGVHRRAADRGRGSGRRHDERPGRMERQPEDLRHGEVRPTQPRGLDERSDPAGSQGGAARRIRGICELTLSVRSTAPSTTLVACLFDVGPDSMARIITHEPLTLTGLAPDQDRNATWKLQAAGYDLPPDHRLIAGCHQQGRPLLVRERRRQHHNDHLPPRQRRKPGVAPGLTWSPGRGRPSCPPPSRPSAHVCHRGAPSRSLPGDCLRVAHVHTRPGC